MNSNKDYSNAYDLHELCKNYPDLMRVRTFVPGRTIILVNNYNLIKKLFVENAEFFSNRPKLGWLDKNLFKGKGTVFFNCENLFDLNIKQLK